MSLWKVVRDALRSSSQPRYARGHVAGVGPPPKNPPMKMGGGIVREPQPYTLDPHNRLHWNIPSVAGKEWRGLRFVSPEGTSMLVEPDDEWSPGTRYTVRINEDGTFRLIEEDR